jgi:hypothetical protein
MEEQKHDHDNITLRINSTRGTVDREFPKVAKIADVIVAAREAFGLAAGDHYQLVLADKPSEVLQPERTLVSYHLKDGTVLTLTWTGSGVWHGCRS